MRQAKRKKGVNMVQFEMHNLPLNLLLSFTINDIFIIEFQIRQTFNGYKAFLNII